MTPLGCSIMWQSPRSKLQNHVFSLMESHCLLLLTSCQPTQKPPPSPKPGHFFGMARSSKAVLTLDVGFHHSWNLTWPYIWVVHVNLGFIFGVWLIIVDFHKANAISNYSKIIIINFKVLVMGIFMVYICI